MSELGHGICRECKVKENDSSKKTLYKCKLCGEWFCSKHFEPRLAFIRDLKSIIKNKRIRFAIEKDWDRTDGHPDFSFTLQRVEEIELEEKIRLEIIGHILDKMKEYDKQRPLTEIEKEPKKESVYDLVRMDMCPSCGSERIMVIAHRKNSIITECLDCKFKWDKLDLKESSFTRGSVSRKPQFYRERKKVDKMSTIIIGSIISIIGIAIILWELYNPFFWTTFFIWFIPIPLVIIGIAMAIFGLFIAIAGATHRTNKFRDTY